MELFLDQPRGGVGVAGKEDSGPIYTPAPGDIFTPGRAWGPSPSLWGPQRETVGLCQVQSGIGIQGPQDFGILVFRLVVQEPEIPRDF